MSSRVIVPIFFAGCALAVAAVSPAFGHASVVSLSPEKGSTANVVETVSFTANEELLDLGNGAGFVFAVTDSEGHFYGDGCVTVKDRTASMTVALGEGGEYSVAYRVVSADGHPIEGSWSFTYEPSADSPIGEAYFGLPVCGETPIPVATPTTEPETSPIPTEEAAATPGFDIIPLIGLATIPIVLGGIWLLARTLGSRDSEDHLT